MNKNMIIGILGIACAALVIFVFVQRAQMTDVATNCEREKVLLEKLAKEQEIRVTEFQVMLDEAKHEALVQRAIAEAQIEELKKKK
jgi:hypothetical protein